MELVAKAILMEGGRVWIASQAESESRQIADDLAVEGPVDYCTGALEDPEFCSQLAELIYQTDGHLDVLVQLIQASDTDYQTLENTLSELFFQPKGKGHIVRWAWQGQLSQATPHTSQGLRVHALFAPPTEAAIPHVLHLASPAAEFLQETRLSLIA